MENGAQLVVAQDGARFDAEMEQQELMRRAHEANARGDAFEALDLFRQCYKAGERLEARISAANMCLKLGATPKGKEQYLCEAISEYRAMLRQVQGAESALPDEARDRLLTLLFRKYGQAIEEAKKLKALRRAQDEAAGAVATANLSAAVRGSVSARGSLTPAAPGMSAGSAARPRSSRASITMRLAAEGGGTARAAEERHSLLVELGTLTVSVLRAVNVPDMDGGGLFAKSGQKKQVSGAVDPFVSLQLRGVSHKTRVGRAVQKEGKEGRGSVSGKERAKAGEYVFVAERFEWRGQLHELAVEPLVVQLRDKDRFGSELIGEGALSLVPLAAESEVTEEVELGAGDGKGAEALKGAIAKCKVKVVMQWTPDVELSDGGRLRIGATTGTTRPPQVELVKPMPGSAPLPYEPLRDANANARQCGFIPLCGFMCAVPRK